MRWGLLVPAALVVSGVQGMVACEWVVLLPRHKRVPFGRLLEAGQRDGHAAELGPSLCRPCVRHLSAWPPATDRQERDGLGVVDGPISRGRLPGCWPGRFLHSSSGCQLGLLAACGPYSRWAACCIAVLIVFAWRHRDFQPVRNPARLPGWARLRYHFSEWASLPARDSPYRDPAGRD